ncbi:MAG: hypothetical protein GC151_08600 [Betaproteobacteria bacterium]|nr:hypothetical protein [Betaproteobacteria bacterium]
MFRLNQNPVPDRYGYRRERGRLVLNVDARFEQVPPGRERRNVDYANGIDPHEPTSTHSRSIIDEPSSLLIRRALATAPKTPADALAVNPSGTRNGAGLPAIGRDIAVRGPSRSID